MTTTTHDTLIDELLSEADAHDGMIPLDLEQFWADNAKANADPFADDCPQLALGLGGNMRECVFTELGIDEDWYRWNHDHAWRAELNKAYNDKSEKIVGKRLLGEGMPDKANQFPPVKQLHDIFEAKNEWHNESYWLHQSANTEDELAALLDRVDKRLDDLASFMLPDNWEPERDRLMAKGKKPPRYRGQRGPVTFATSIYGAENLMFLLMDNVKLSERLRDTIIRAMLERARILDEQAGFTPEQAPHGFTFLDDNCALLTPDMYEMFGKPVLQTLFDRYSPDPGDSRYQHSDSDMGHLLPILGSLKLTGCNFGPNLTVRQIREHLPNAVIQGQLAPFTLSRDDRRGCLAELFRDFDDAKATGKGVCFTTAGSVNNGSRLATLRLIMAAIQRHCRY